MVGSLSHTASVPSRLPSPV